MQAYQRFWLVAVCLLGGLCAALAIISLSLVALVGVAISSALAACLARLLAADGSSTPVAPGARGVLVGSGRPALVGAAIGISLVGAGQGAGPAGVLLLLIAGAASPMVVRWISGRLSLLRRIPVETSVEANEMTDGELIRAWRLSYVQMAQARSAFELGTVTEHRSRLLDEMQHRDPEGFSRWMLSGARDAGDPTRYLRSWPGAEPEGNH